MTTGEFYDRESDEVLAISDETEHEARVADALAAAVADATSPAAQRLAVVDAEAANNAALQRLAAQGVGLTQDSLIMLRLQLFVEHVLGDLDMPRRLDFEAMFQARLAEVIANGESQVARAKLLQGVQLDQPKREPRR